GYKRRSGACVLIHQRPPDPRIAPGKSITVRVQWTRFNLRRVPIPGPTIPQYARFYRELRGTLRSVSGVSDNSLLSARVLVPLNHHQSRIVAEVPILPRPDIELALQTPGMFDTPNRWQQFRFKAVGGDCQAGPTWIDRIGIEFTRQWRRSGKAGKRKKMIA